jgi:uncharacterized Zn-binding protein involved in type VI secretion
MPAIATGDGPSGTPSIVFSLTGNGKDCRFPVTTKSGEFSDKVFVEGAGVVTIGMRVFPHPNLNCGVDESPLTQASSKVFVGGLGVARIGDEYTSDNIITSGSAKVFVGG